MFGNDATATNRYHGSFVDPGWSAKQHGSSTAFVGDINASVSIRLTRVWSVRTGYNLIWIDRIAFAPDQALDNPDFKIATDGNVFLQGVNVGLEGQW